MTDSLATQNFIERARKVHGDRYDYSLVNYIRSTTQIKIICKQHGIFLQLPNSHLRPSHCLKCSYEKRGNKTRKSKKDFVKRARKIHGNKYDYRSIKYIDRKQ